MKFSKDTIEKLKNFAQINPSIWFDKGYKVKTLNPPKTIWGYTEIEDHIDSSFGVYDLHAFLDLLSMLGPEATIEHDAEQNLIYMKNAYSQINFLTATREAINDGYEVQELKLPDPVLTFDLKADALNQIIKIAKKTGVNAIAIESEKDKVMINGYQVAEIKRNLNDPKMFSMDVAPYDGTNKFKFFINMINMIIPVMDYQVSVYIVGVNMAVVFKTENSTFMITLEITSEHDFDV